MEIIETEELKDFDYLHNLYFKDEYNLPSLSNISTVRVVKNNDKPIASGIVKLCVEAIIVTDQDISPRDRIEAIDLMVANMQEWCRENSIEQIQVYVKEGFAKVLVKRYGFKPVNDIPLVLQVEKDA